MLDDAGLPAADVNAYDALGGSPRALRISGICISPPPALLPPTCGEESASRARNFVGASNKRLLPEGPSPEPSFCPSVRTGRALLSMRVPARLRRRRLRSPWWRRAPRIARKLRLAIGLQGTVLAQANGAAMWRYATIFEIRPGAGVWSFDLSIAHDRFGSSSHVQQNGCLSHPQDLDAPLRIAAQDCCLSATIR